MITYPLALFLQLVESFPDAMSATRIVASYETYNGPFGTEDIYTGDEIENLGEDILSTACTIQVKYGEAAALDYIKTFSDPRVQRAELRGWNVKRGTN